jgi:hypothetical protein
MSYDVNYDDQRFKDVEADKTEALSELENTYSDMVNNSDKYYQAQVDASKQWEKTQTENQQAQTDFAIEQIEQQKQQAEKDYKKEQSGAYKDWKVESNRYGANAETMAQQGMINSGYAESAQVSMYNTYQGRVAQAREVYNTAVMNYNNAIKDARLQNNSVLAQIAYQSLQTQLELSLQGFQYKNQLILDKLAKKTEVDQMYYGRYQDVLNQINHENAFQFQLDQYNDQMAMKNAATSAGSSLKIKHKNDEEDDNEGNNPILKVGNEPSNYSDYEGAVNYLKSKGIVTKGDGGIMTKNEWLRRKASGVKSEVTAYDSYEEYLKALVEWKVTQSKVSGKVLGGIDF